jgi:rhodanese-related sulfurtransferase
MAEPVNRDELQTLVNNGAQVIEVLGRSEYEHAHIPDAMNIPLAELSSDAAAALIRERMIVLYCYDFQ